jgi:hypothetical protein
MTQFRHPLRIIRCDLLRPVSGVSEPTIRKLAARMASDGIQKNPIAVAGIDPDHYVVLDGVSRWSALRRLGIKDALTQVVDLDDPELSLLSWNHVVKHLTALELEKIAARLDLELSKSGGTSTLERESLSPDDVVIALNNGGIYRVRIDRSDLGAFNNALSRMVCAYSANSQIIRIPFDTTISNSLISRSGEAFVVLPVFRHSEVIRLHESGNLLPPHTLCYSFPCRYLGIKLSLDILSQNATSDEKNGFLDELIRMRLSRSRAVYYPQSVFLMND